MRSRRLEADKSKVSFTKIEQKLLIYKTWIKASKIPIEFLRTRVQHV